MKIKKSLQPNIINKSLQPASSSTHKRPFLSHTRFANKLGSNYRAQVSIVKTGGIPPSIVLYDTPLKRYPSYSSDPS